MADTGWKSPATAASVDRDSSPAWSNPSNALAIDTSDASVVVNNLNNTYSDWLRLTNYGLNIPAGAAINGIVAEITRHASNFSLYDSSLRLWDGSAVQGGDKASGVQWPLSEAAVERGSAGDIWSWSGVTPDALNASGFGVQLSVRTTASTDRTAYVGCIRIKVFYTEAATGRIIKPLLPCYIQYNPRMREV